MCGRGNRMAQMISRHSLLVLSQFRSESLILSNLPGKGTFLLALVAIRISVIRHSRRFRELTACLRGSARIGGDVNRFLSLLKLSIWLSFRVNSSLSLFFRCFFNGSATDSKSLANIPYTFQSPKKEHNCDFASGDIIFCVESIFLGATDSSFGLKISSRYSIESFMKKYLLIFFFIPAFCENDKTVLRLMRCSSTFLENTLTTSRYILDIIGSD